MVHATDCFPCRPDGVELIGLGAVLGRLRGGTVDLDDDLAVAAQRHGCPGPVAAGAFDGPQARVASGVVVSPGDESPVAVGVGRESAAGNDAGGRFLNDGGGDPVAIGINTNDVDDLVMKQRTPPCGVDGPEGAAAAGL
jgi:hypothetical protein